MYFGSKTIAVHWKEIKGPLLHNTKINPAMLSEQGFIVSAKCWLKPENTVAIPMMEREIIFDTAFVEYKLSSWLKPFIGVNVNYRAKLMRLVNETLEGENQ